MGNADELWSFQELQNRIGAPSRCSVVRWVRAGSFPAPVRIGPRRIAWRRGDVEAWLAQRKIGAAQQVRR